MTGSVVGCAFNSNRRPVTKSGRFQLLSDVAHASTEGPRPGIVFFIVRQQVSVSSEHRAAATRVCYYGLITHAKGIDVLSGQDARATELAGMHMQRTTTDLPRRCLPLTSVCCQHSSRSRINSLKQTFSDTTFEQQHRRSARHRSARILRAARRHPACCPLDAATV